jgi:hypothetical protein
LGCAGWDVFRPNSVDGVSLPHSHFFSCLFNLGIIYNHGSGVLDAGRGGMNLVLGLFFFSRNQLSAIRVWIGIGVRIGNGRVLYRFCCRLLWDGMHMRYEFYLVLGCLCTCVYLYGWING